MRALRMLRRTALSCLAFSWISSMLPTYSRKATPQWIWRPPSCLACQLALPRHHSMQAFALEQDLREPCRCFLLQAKQFAGSIWGEWRFC